MATLTIQPDTAWALLTRIADFMRRCNPDKAKPGENATNDEWDELEAEVNAAIGGPIIRTEMDHG